MFFLSLADIAGWPPFDPIVPAKLPPMVAGIPSLQRGLVWDPGRVEMLWDSLFRGFPIGSFVACDRLNDEVQATRNVLGGIGVTHHLLDGQQRAQAIGLGFHDPFAKPCHRVGRVLWLDLAPPKLGETRVHLFRTTTRAHPWGYAANDRATTVGIARMRDSLRECKAIRDANDVFVRPEPEDCWPIEAGAPVPLAWLLADPKMSESLRARLEEVAERPWALQVKQALDENGSVVDKIRYCLYRTAERRILCEILPREALDTSNDPVSTVENLFQRLNTGGKPLDGDDLAWSLLKARWPRLEPVVVKLAGERRVPEARLIRLAARLPLMEAAIAGSYSRALSTTVSVAQIRRLSTESNKDGRPFADFLLHGGLEQAVHLVARWMGASGPHDLPPVLQTQIARGTPDAYVLALWLARRATCDGTADDPSWGRPVQALLSALRWFSRNPSKSVDAIVRRMSERPPGPQALRGILLKLEAEERPLMAIPRPSLVKTALAGPRGNDPDKWSFSAMFEGLVDLEVDALRRIRDNREMMLYAQRDWLQRAFPRYDPADEDTWRDHGRPWDFDHLLPWAAISYKTIQHKDVLKEWAGSIGNFRAWPLEDNRSSGDQAPDEKLANLKNQLSSFMSESEYVGIGRGLLATKEMVSGDPNGHLAAFIDACSSRMQRMHAAWWGKEGLAVGYLLDDKPDD